MPKNVKEGTKVSKIKYKRGSVCKRVQGCVLVSSTTVCVSVWSVQSLMDATALLLTPATYITLFNEILFKSSIFNQLLCHSFFFLAPLGALGGVVFLDRSKPSQAKPSHPIPS